MSQEKSSEWQEKITGEWYGCPSVFDIHGHHKGFNKVNRSSVFENGRTTYYMDTKLDVVGDLRARFEAQNFAFGVLDSDQDRIYMGPDFYGSGQPYGMLVDAHYYSPGWAADLKTMVHILPDGKTQVYSSQLFEGPRLISVFNGVYKMAHDYDSNEETKRFIDKFIMGEKAAGSNPYILPMKEEGIFKGEFDVYNIKQELVGKNYVKIDYQPLDLKRATVKVSMEGVVNDSYQYERSREGMRHDFCGPDVYGNGFAYGRALYSSQHRKGKAQNIKSRDFIIDDQYTTSSVWQIQMSSTTKYTMFGVLDFESTGSALRPQYN